MIFCTVALKFLCVCVTNKINKNKWNLTMNTPGVWKGGQELKHASLKKLWNQMGSHDLLVLIGLKVLVMMTSLQNIFISGVQGLLMLMGSKLLTKMIRLQNIVFIYLKQLYY